MPLEKFIESQRDLLRRLESFSQTADYKRLLETLEAHSSEDPECWLGNWLIQPAFELGARPIEFVDKPDGMDLLVTCLLRIVHNTGA